MCEYEFNKTLIRIPNIILKTKKKKEKRHTKNNLLPLIFPKINSKKLRKAKSKTLINVLKTDFIIVNIFTLTRSS